jgi:hypothetical protein
MPVGLPSAAKTAEPDLELEAVTLFSFAGLTLSFYLFHLLPIAMANATMLLACAG